MQCCPLMCRHAASGLCTAIGSAVVAAYLCRKERAHNKQRLQRSLRQRNKVVIGLCSDMFDLKSTLKSSQAMLVGKPVHLKHWHLSLDVECMSSDTTLAVHLMSHETE